MGISHKIVLLNVHQQPMCSNSVSHIPYLGFFGHGVLQGPTMSLERFPQIQERFE